MWRKQAGTSSKLSTKATTVAKICTISETYVYWFNVVFDNNLIVFSNNSNLTLRNEFVHGLTNQLCEQKYVKMYAICYLRLWVWVTWSARTIMPARRPPFYRAESFIEITFTYELLLILRQTQQHCCSMKLRFSGLLFWVREKLTLESSSLIESWCIIFN